MITGRGRYVDDMVVPGMLYMAVVRSPEAHAKIVSIDASGARGAARRPRRVHRRGPRHRRRACRWRGCRRASRSRRPSTGRSPRTRSSTSARASRSSSATTSTRVVDAAEQVLVEYDPLPVVVDPEKAIEDGSTLVHHDLGTNAGPRVVDRRRRHGRGLGRGRRRDRAADRQPPHGRHADRAARLHRRLPQRPAHAAPHEPEPAPDPPVHGGRARDGRGQHPRDRARRRAAASA